MCVKDRVPAMAFEKSSKKMVYTFKEVAEHNSPGDLWIVIYGKVYDVSNFVTEHPGGEIPLFDKGGEDATEEFQNMGHSDDAKKLMIEYYIGDICEEAMP